MRMKYIFMRLSCALHGHDWRRTSSPYGNHVRCWRCYLAR
jgi:hypothetical protein